MVIINKRVFCETCHKHIGWKKRKWLVLDGVIQTKDKKMLSFCGKVCFNKWKESK